MRRKSNGTQENQYTRTKAIKENAAPPFNMSPRVVVLVSWLLFNTSRKKKD